MWKWTHTSNDCCDTTSQRTHAHDRVTNYLSPTLHIQKVCVSHGKNMSATIASFQTSGVMQRRQLQQNPTKFICAVALEWIDALAPCSFRRSRAANKEIPHTMRTILRFENETPIPFKIKRGAARKMKLSYAGLSLSHPLIASAFYEPQPFTGFQSAMFVDWVGTPRNWICLIFVTSAP